MTRAALAEFGLASLRLIAVGHERPGGSHPNGQRRARLCAARRKPQPDGRAPGWRDSRVGGATLSRLDAARDELAGV
jgi:hypothetical protein